MTFYEIEFPLATLSLDEVEAALLELGADSITFVDRGDEPVLEPKPGEMRLWSDTLVRALFQEAGGARTNAQSRTARRALRPGVQRRGPRESRRGSGLGTRVARRLEIDAFRPAALGVPDGG